MLYGLPALLFRAVRTKSRHSLTLVAVAGIGLAIEAAYLIVSPCEGSAGRFTHIGADTTMLLVVKKVFGLAALGDVNFAQSWPLRQAPLWAWTITFVLLALVVAVFVALRVPQRYGLLCCVLGAWFLAIWSHTAPGGQFSAPLLPGIGNRYFVPAIAAIYLLVLMATSRRRLRRWSSRRRPCCCSWGSRATTTWHRAAMWIGPSSLDASTARSRRARS